MSEGAFRVRSAAPEDARALLEIYRPVVLETAISFETEPPSEAELAHRIRRTLEAYPWLVREGHGGVLEGYAYAGAHRTRPAYRWSVEVSAYVREDRRRRGVATSLYRALLATLTDQGFVQAFAGIALPNPGSVAFHEGMGFERVGVFREVGFKMGGWHDVGWWQRRLGPTATSPEPPTPFPSVGPLREGGG